MLLLQAKISERMPFQEFKDYLYLAINSLLEDFKSKSEIMVRYELIYSVPFLVKLQWLMQHYPVLHYNLTLFSEF
jgi:hypothetical protein